MMYFLGFLCLLLSAAATPIISRFGNQPSDGESKISYIVLKPSDLSQLGNFPWSQDLTDKSDDMEIFIITGGNKKFGHLSALKQLQNNGRNKVSIADNTESNKSDETNKNINGITIFDRPCNRYDANEVTAKINAVEPEVKVNSITDYTNEEENKQGTAAFTNNDELKNTDKVNYKIPAPPSIDISSKTGQKLLLSDKSGYKYQPEIYKIIKNKSVLNAGQASSGITVQPSPNYDEQWVSEDNTERLEKEQEINEHSILSEPKTNIVEKTVKESDSSEEDSKPIVNLNIPAPPSIEDAITLPSGYSSLSALQNEEKILMEKIKKLHSSLAQVERVEDKSRSEYNQDVHSGVVIKKPTSVASATGTHVTQGTPTSIDISVVHNSAQWSQAEEKPEKAIKEVSNESSMETTTEPESVKKATEKSVTTESRVEEPLAKLNIPAPPSLDNTITLPSGYSSLSDLLNEERLILQKVKPVRLEKQEIGDKLSHQYHPESYKIVNVHINPAFNAEQEKAEKEANPSVTVQTPALPSVDPFFGHDMYQWIHEAVSGKKTSEAHSNDHTNTEDRKTAVILHIPPPPSIENSITLPSGYSSLEAIQNEEKNILHRIENMKITQRQSGQAIDSKNFGNNPGHYKIDVAKKTPCVSVVENKSVGTVDIPAPPTIESLSHYDKQHDEEKNDANTQITPVYVSHNNGEESSAKTNIKENNNNEHLSNQKTLKPFTPLHIPQPPSINEAIILPSGYPTLTGIRNEEIILMQKLYGNVNHVQQQPSKVVEESDSSPPQINRVEVVGKQPESNVQEPSHTVKYNIPLPPSLDRSVVLPSGYLTHSNIQDIERWIIQKIKEQREKQAVKDSDRKAVVPDRPVVWVKPDVKMNIPPPPSIAGVSEYTEYAKQQKVNRPPVHIRGPIIRWNTPAPPTQKRV